MERKDTQQPGSLTHGAADPQRQSPTTGRQPTARVRDLPGCIKYILLALLLALLFAEYWAGEFGRVRELGLIIWLILLIKIILIIGLIILIWVQRKLRCEITAPVGCTNVEYDPATDTWFIRVMGTASGTLFGNYTLAVERPPGTSLAGATIIYPGGGGSGTAPVINGELGRIEVSDVEPAPTRVILTVNPSGAGSSCVDTSDFDWANRTTSIAAIGGVEARWVGGVKLITGPPPPAPAGPPVSVGAGVTVEGTADYTGCGREMIEYALFHKIVNVGESPWPGSDPGPWTNILSPLPFGDPAHPRSFLYLEDSSSPGMATHYNTVRSRGNLTRVWSIGPFLMPPPPPPENFVSRPFTQASGWGTEGEGLNGRYTVRLRVTHDLTGGGGSPVELYSTATVWIDNRDIEGRIWELGVAGGGGLSVCDEILMSQFVTPNPLNSPGPFSKVNATINGRAWDPVILDSYLLPGPTADQPNDNFDKYVLDFKKNGEVTWVGIHTSSTRVPNILQEAPLPALPANLAQLALWDIVGALDAGPPQIAPAPYPKIYRGERCAYLIRLQVWDKTLLDDGGSVHYIPHDFPFCIMNDLPENVPFPVP